MADGVFDGLADELKSAAKKQLSGEGNSGNAPASHPEPKAPPSAEQANTVPPMAAQANAPHPAPEAPQQQSKFDKIKGAASDVGSKFLGGAASGAGFLATATPHFKRAGRAASGEGFFFIFVFAFVIYDAFNDFRIAPFVRLGIYLLIAFWAIFLTYKTGFSSESGLFLGLSLASFAVGHFFTTAQIISSVPMLRYIVLLAPVWILYFVFTEHDSTIIHWFSKGYLAFWIFLFVFWLFSGQAEQTLGLGGVDSESAIDSSGVFKTFWAWLKDTFKNGWGSISNIQAMLNGSATQFYTEGSEEQTAGPPVGVYIENVRTDMPENQIYENKPLVLFADLNVNSKLDEPIRISNSCYAQKLGEEAKKTGTARPQAIDALGFESEYLTCTIGRDDSANLLQKGSYLARFVSSFNFQTTGYITYYFTTLDLLKIYGKDFNLENKITPQPLIHNAGPLGLKTLENAQPLGMELEQQPFEFQQSFVLEITNSWPAKGKLSSLQELKIFVPDGFALHDCSLGIQPQESREQLPGLNEVKKVYIFTNLEIPQASSYASTDPRIKTFTCAMRIDNPKEFMGTNPIAVPKTFVIIAKYTYELFAEKSISVLADPAAPNPAPQPTA
ncbi:MAG: hypothetical protein V1659_05240 [Candidatus Woesearchaeota archaeon]